jgi:hypothetical protein
MNEGTTPRTRRETTRNSGRNNNTNKKKEARRTKMNGKEQPTYHRLVPTCFYNNNY